MTIKILFKAYKTHPNPQEWYVWYRSRLMKICYSWNEAHSKECEINRKINREIRKIRRKENKTKRYGGYKFRNNEPIDPTSKIYGK